MRGYVAYLTVKEKGGSSPGAVVGRWTLQKPGRRMEVGFEGRRAGEELEVEATKMNTAS